MSHLGRVQKSRARPHGWVHNPYKNSNQPHYIVDQDATKVAEHYIELFIRGIMIEGYMPITAVEVNFTASGAPGIERKIIDYINEETKRQDAKRHAESATKIAALHAKLATLPEFLDGREPEKESADAARAFQLFFARIKEPGPIEYKLIGLFLSKLDALVILSKQDAAQPQINPEFLAAIKDYCREVIKEHIIAPQKGAYTRAYMEESVDEKGRPVWVDFPELTTPPRAPSITWRQVHAIKRLLLESSDHFHGRNISPIAQRMKKALGPYNISFLDQDAYFNLSEHISFSLQEMDPQHNTYQHARNADGFMDHNAMRKPFQNRLFSEAFARYLPADRIMAVGNRFPFDEATQNSDDKISIRSNGIGHRVEIRNFADATSNSALSLLPVLGIAFMTLVAQKHVHDEAAAAGKDSYSVADILNMLAETYNFKQTTVPQTPQDAKDGLNLSMTIRAMYAVRMAELHREGVPREEAETQTCRELDIFEDMLRIRQNLLLNRPWGGRDREATEAANKWRIANLKPRAASVPSDRDAGQNASR